MMEREDISRMDPHAAETIPPDELTEETTGDAAETLLPKRYADPSSSAPTSDEADATIPLQSFHTPHSFGASGDDEFEVIPGKIGQYEITRELARGGMGVVYLGVRRDGRFHRRVAVKVIKRGMDTDEVLRRFELERQLLGSLNHANIGQLYDGGVTENGLPFFAMEFVDGEPLDKYCDRKSLNLGQRLRLFLDVCAGVQYAHRNMVVHRDLKPANILVNSEGIPKLLDFGIAKLVKADGALLAADMTAPDRRPMTPEYASPEQVRGDQVTTATDVYALGVILYELLTGHRPYQLRERVRSEIERVVLEVEPQRPSTIVTREEQIEHFDDPETSHTFTITPESVSKVRGDRPERLRKTLAGDLDVIMLKALRKEPQQRYQTVAEFSDDINRYLTGLPVAARPQSMTYRVHKYVRRNRAGVGVAAMVLVAAVLSVALAFNAKARDAADARADARAAEADAAEARADAARVAAECRAAQVRELTRFYLTDLHASIARMPGSLLVREMIVAKAMEDLKVLAAEAAQDDDPQLDLELAIAFDKLGEMQAGVRNPSLGTAARAQTSYETARRYCEGVLEAVPDHSDALRQLSIVHIHLGDLRDASEDYAGSLEEYQRALALAEQLRESAPGDPLARRQVAVAMLEIGQALRRLNRDDEAETQIRQSIAIREQLAGELPADVTTQRDLSTGYNLMGGVESSRQRLADAQEQYEKALAIREHLCEIDTESARASRDVAQQHLLIGDVCRRRNDIECAQRHLQSYIELSLQLASANPLDQRAQADLTRAHDWITHLRRLTNDDEAAIQNFMRYHDGLVRLVQFKPSELDRRKLLLINQFLLGRLLNETGRYPEAVRMFDFALDTAQAIATQTGEAVDQIAVAEVLVESAPVFEQDGQDVRAQANLREAIAVVDGLSPDQRERPDAQQARQRAAQLLGGETDIR